LFGTAQARVAAAVLAVFGILASCDSPAGPARTGLIILSPKISDTVGLTHTIEVELRNASGEPIPGAALTYEPTPELAAVYDLGTSSVTDNRGRAEVVLTIGYRTAAGYIVVTAPDQQLSDSVKVDILPGKAYSLEGAADTAVVIDGTAQLGARVVDKYGNSRPGDPITYTTSSSAVMSISSAGLARALAYGTGTVLASSAVGNKETRIVVVPPGTFVASHTFDSDDSTYLVMVNTDLTRRTIVSEKMQYSTVNISPAWSPDGERIVYTPPGPSGTFAGQRIYVTDLQGNRTRLIPSGSTSLSAERFPRYSPDGKYIYFGGMTADGYSSEVWRVNANGTSPVRISAAASGFHWDGQPDPSPDGAKLLYYSSDATATPGVHLFNLSAKTSTLVMANTFACRWAPPGDRVVCPNGYNGLVVRSLVGAYLGLLGTPNMPYNFELGYSSDGKWIVAQGTNGIELIETSTNLVLLLPNTLGLSSPTWRPAEF
jgi:hypothetical protein